MPQNVAQKLISSHLVEGEMTPGEEIGLRIDQTLTQDATGTMVMLELEAMGLDRAQTELSVQYVDHNLLQAGSRNAEDHEFLRSASRRFGLWFSGPGNGVSHPTHMERFGLPGKTMVGSDSHTPAAGSLGMLAIGLGGIEVARAIAGEPVYLQMPKIWGVRLINSLPDWVSAKDVILEMLRRHSVKGGVNRVIEYYGPGVATLSAMDRHVIANMGAELGATSTVFPADERVRDFLRWQQREDDYVELLADEGARYDVDEEIDLAALEPLIALPSAPDNVRPVAEVAGDEVEQVVIGSSANPGLRDFMAVAAIVQGRRISPGLSLDVNPTSRELLQDLMKTGAAFDLIAAGARLHQSGCLGCIGMGQSPTSNGRSLRTMPRNFPGRSGTADDQVYLCSPETAAAAALTGVITDPRTLPDRFQLSAPKINLPNVATVNTEMVEEPLPPDQAREVKLIKGENIAGLPELEPLPDRIEAPALIKVSDDISTDTIMPAGAEALPYRSNIAKLSRYAFKDVNSDYHDQAVDVRDRSGHVIIGGDNYGQGSSREHAAIAPRFLGLRMVLAKSYARIHWQNLINFGVLPLEFDDPDDYDGIEIGDVLAVDDLRRALDDETLMVQNTTQDAGYRARHRLSRRQLEILLVGGLIPWLRDRDAGATDRR
ncbi:aconitate hydratase [Microlunatus elymi]|uniref:Aconitate hydratase n=1 Tax=Microlunatus elymi TaxID=2596828 RepID=A0A516PYM3_9ACTN|nr:aconitate hydratase [Microlunatus elymi]QDP96276.1 aconitate hydratase [Microlunatus elymi]